MAWEKVKLGDICESISDGDHLPPPKSVDGIPFVTISNVNSSNQFDFKNTMFVPQEYYEKLDEKRKPRINDILYSVVGSFGIPVFIKENRPFVFQRHIAILRPNESRIHPRYLYYKMLSKDFYMKADAVAIGAAQRTISLTSLRNMEISIPCKDLQKRIADILSAYDNLIENNQKQIKLLEEAAQRLYKQWFIDLRFPGHETTKIVDGIPQGWKKVALGDVYGKIESGSRPKGGIDSSIRDGVVSVGAENVIGLGQYNYSSEKLVSHEFYENSKRGKVEDRDILVYKDGAYIGRTSLFQDEFPRKVMMVNEHVFLLNAKNPLYQYYLFFTLNRQEYFDKMQKLNKNSAQPGINQDALKSLVIIWPSDEIVMKFDNFVAPMVKKIFALAKQNYELSQSRDRLLPKLMNGELEV